ncbi:MAG TPA: thermonuclease family protein, partial [Limnochordia bacterium]|nr:thermonuclease family protein [Limnochordia bacterium]
IPTGAQAAVVTRVIDGDTIDVTLDGRSVRVRYIGINTPETHHPDESVQHFGDEATAANRALLRGGRVWLLTDAEAKDRYNRLLAYVFVPPHLFVNAWLVEAGYAHRYTFPPNVRYADLFGRLEASARGAQRGLWAHPDPGPPLTPEEAARHSGEYRTVVGRVQRVVTLESGLIMVDFTRSPGFTLVIEPDDAGRFGDAPGRVWRGERLAVSGWLYLYRGQPEIRAADPTQVVVLAGDEIHPSR